MGKVMAVSVQFTQALNAITFDYSSISNIFTLVPSSSSYSSSTKTKECSSYTILGGEGIFSTSKYIKILQIISNMPPHYNVHLEFKLYRLGDWTSSGMTVSAFSANVAEKEYLKYSGSNVGASSKQCNIKKSFITILSFDINDNFDSTINIFYNYHSDNDFGIRDVTVILALCVSNCLLCNGPLISNCNQCITNAELPNCICKSGFYLVSCGQLKSGSICVDKCVACNPTCTECTSSTTCTSCQPGYTLSSGTCISGCLDSQYKDTNNNCVNCPTQCSTCSSSTECLTCSNSFFFLNPLDGSCGPTCPIGTFPYIFNRTCQSCHETCYKCSGSSLSSCTECAGYFPYFYSGVCVRNCIDGTYLVNGSCLSCNPACATCSGPNSNNCLSCSGSQLLYNGECLNDCPDGTFPASNICNICDPLCLTCTGFSENECLSCPPDLNRTFANGSCICIDGTFENTDTETCEVCDSSCLTCSLNSTFCQSCTSDKILVKGKCLKCEDGTFLNTILAQCDACNPSCLTCSGSQSNQCSSCTGEKNFINNECKCNPGDYFNNVSTLCEKCDSNCLTCSGTQTNCISCDTEGIFFMNKCYFCENGTFFDDTIPGCRACDISCLTCDGVGVNHCTSCSNDKTFANGSCVCFAGTFENTDTGTCEVCDSSCLTCSLNSTFCQSCTSDKILVKGKCLKCEDGTFLNTVLAQCDACNPSCLTCSGSQSNQCNSCTGEKNFINNQCKCNSGYYFNSASTLCEKCDANCLTCSGTKTNCISCDIGGIFFMNKCYFCKNGTFFDDTIPGCRTCDISCLTCDGVGVNHCTSCSNDKTFIAEENSCICKSGTFLNENTHFCDKCASLCLTCFNSSQNCTSCSSDKILVNNSCICQSEGYYLDSSTSICRKCDSSCLKCKGSRDVDCISCANPEYNLMFGSCFEICPEGYFNDSNKNCAQCPKNCKTCTSTKICDICVEGYTTTSSGCLLQKKVYATYETIQNPTSFKLNFTYNWENFMSNLENNMDIKINDYPSSDFNYETTTKENQALLLINYKTALNSSSLKLNISFHAENSDSEYVLMTKELIIPLESFIICQTNFYYNSSSKTCQAKNLLKPKLGLMSNHLQISLVFTYSFKNFFEYLDPYSKIEIEGFTLGLDYNTTIMKNGDDTHFYIEINTTKPILNGPKLKYCLNLDKELISAFNLLIQPNCDEISLMDWYPLSESTKKSIESAKKQGEVNNMMSSNGMSTILASTSGIFLFGLMMIEMIYFLKYINVNFPMNALAFFESQQPPYTLFFHYNFISDENSKVLPDIYTYYSVSPYFLNNCGEILCQISAVFFFALIMTAITYFFTKKIFIITFLVTMIKGMFVWEMTILFVFLSIQKLAFYIASAVCFFPISYEGKLNSIIALILGLCLIVWLSTLFYHARNCQNFRLKNGILSIASSSVKKTISSNGTTDNEHKKVTPMNFISLKGAQKNKSTNESNSSPLMDMKKNKIAPFNPEEDIDKSQISSSNRSQNILLQDNTSPTPKQISKGGVNFIYLNSPNLPPENKPRTWKIKDKINEIRKSISDFTKDIPVKIKRIKVFSCLFHISDWIKYLKRYGTLYQDLKCETIWQKYYKLFYYCRQIIISLLVPTLYHYPVPQMMIITLFYALFVITTIFKNPYDSKIIFVINVVSDLITFSAILSVTALVFMDYFEEEDYNLKMNFGWMIIFANLALLYWVMLTGVIKIIYHLIFKYKQYKLRQIINPMNN